MLTFFLYFWIVPRQSKSTKKLRQAIVNSSDEEVKVEATVSYQSDRTVENKRDQLATSEVQIDTEIGQDARTIFEKSLQGKSFVVFFCIYLLFKQ